MLEAAPGRLHAIALGGKDGWALAAWFDFIDMRANGYDSHPQLLDGKASYNDTNVRARSRCGSS